MTVEELKLCAYFNQGLKNKFSNCTSNELMVLFLDFCMSRFSQFSQYFVMI